MGRKRKKDKYLPPCVYEKHGGYYLVKNNKWTLLGNTLQEMFLSLSKLEEDRPLRTMADICNKYSLEVMPLKAKKTQKSQALYLERIKAVFGEMNPNSVKPKHIYRFRHRLADKGPTAANRALEVLKHLFSKAIEWGIIDTNPARDVRKLTAKDDPRLIPRNRYVEDWEFDAVHQAAPPRVQIAMDLAVLTGLRRGDLLALTRDHITDEGILITPSKTEHSSGQTLLIEWSNELRAVIDRAKRLPPQVRQPIIANRRGKAYTPDGFASNFQRAMKKALEGSLQEPFCFHDLRAKSASDDDDRNAGSKRLGHADTRTTERFYQRKPIKVRPLR
jgi:integrase